MPLRVAATCGYLRLSVVTCCYLPLRRHEALRESRVLIERRLGVCHIMLGDLEGARAHLLAGVKLLEPGNVVTTNGADPPPKVLRDRLRQLRRADVRLAMPRRPGSMSDASRGEVLQLELGGAYELLAQMAISARQVIHVPRDPHGT